MENIRINKAAEILSEISPGMTAEDLLNFGTKGELQIIAPVISDGLFEWPKLDEVIYFPEIDEPIKCNYDSSHRVILLPRALLQIEGRGWTIPDEFIDAIRAQKEIERLECFMPNPPWKDCILLQPSMDSTNINKLLNYQRAILAAMLHVPPVIMQHGIRAYLSSYLAQKRESEMVCPSSKIISFDTCKPEMKRKISYNRRAFNISFSPDLVTHTFTRFTEDKEETESVTYRMAAKRALESLERQLPNQPSVFSNDAIRDFRESSFHTPWHATNPSTATSERTTIQNLFISESEIERFKSVLTSRKQAAEVVPTKLDWKAQIQKQAGILYLELTAHGGKQVLSKLSVLLAEWCRENKINEKNGKTPSATYIYKHVIGRKCWTPPTIK